MIFNALLFVGLLGLLVYTGYQTIASIGPILGLIFISGALVLALITFVGLNKYAEYVGYFSEESYNKFIMWFIIIVLLIIILI